MSNMGIWRQMSVQSFKYNPFGLYVNTFLLYSMYTGNGTLVFKMQYFKHLDEQIQIFFTLFNVVCTIKYALK